MSCDVMVDQALGMVQVTYHGEVLAEERKAARDWVFQTCKEKSLSRVLVDLRDCTIQMNEKDAISFAANFKHAKDIPDYRVACVFVQRNESESLVEVLITHEGVNIKYFLSPEDATLWLMAR